MNWPSYLAGLVSGFVYLAFLVVLWAVLSGGDE